MREDDDDDDLTDDADAEEGKGEGRAAFGVGPSIRPSPPRGETKPYLGGCS